MIVRLRSRKRDNHGRFLYVKDWDRDTNAPVLTGDQNEAYTFKSVAEAGRVKDMCGLLYDYDPVFGVGNP